MAARPVTTVDHLLVETKDSVTGGGHSLLRDARVLAEGGHRVAVVLMQDAAAGVIGRDGARAVREAASAGAAVLVDGFSLRQRAVRDGDLPEEAVVADADDIAALMLVPGVKVVWR